MEFRMKECLIVAGLLIGTNSFAALSPYYDSVEKIQVVLASYPLSSVTAGPITSIKEVNGMTYEVQAGNCTAQVSLQAHPPGMSGKTTYSVLTASKPICQ
jgi:hypothetical protein